MQTITGEKVFLLPITLDDTEFIVKWRNTDSVRQNFVFQKEFTNEMHENWMNTKVRNGEVVQYVIYEKETRIPIGSIYYRDIDKYARSAEYGIFIGEDFARGKGLGTEAALLFIRFGFRELKFHRIFLKVFEDNVQAISSYKKAGFKLEGVARDYVFQNNRYRNMVFMSILEDDFMRVDKNKFNKEK